MKPSDEDYKYPRVKWGFPWPCWIGIAMFIGGILVIILFSPPEVDYIAGLCSVGGLLITAMIAGFDYSNKTVVDMMREEFRLNRESHKTMMEILERGREEHKAMIDSLKEISNSLRKER